MGIIKNKKTKQKQNFKNKKTLKKFRLLLKPKKKKLKNSKKKLKNSKNKQFPKNQKNPKSKQKQKPKKNKEEPSTNKMSHFAKKNIIATSLNSITERSAHLKKTNKKILSLQMEVPTQKYIKLLYYIFVHFYLYIIKTKQ